MDLNSIIDQLKTEQERIGRAITALLDGAGMARRGHPPKAAPKRKGGMSPEARHRIALAMKRRWAESRAKNSGVAKAAPSPKKRGGSMTPAGRKRLSEMMKKRWAERRKAASKG